MTHELHPLCTLFPRMPDAELQQLAEDIAANGLQQPIVLHDGMILDGGNRYRACQLAGVEPTFVQFNGASIVAFVLGANLHRRHMTPGQQAAIVAAAQDWARAQGRGGDRGNQYGPSQAATLPLASIADRAAQSGASERTQRMADKVAREAPELARQVAHGEVSLPAAVRQVEGKEPTARQAPKSDDVEELRAKLAAAEDQIAELAAMCDELREDRDSLARVFEANDQIQAALTEAKRYREQVSILEARVRGQASECAEAKRAAKMWRAKFDKLERQHANNAP